MGREGGKETEMETKKGYKEQNDVVHGQPDMPRGDVKKKRRRLPKVKAIHVRKHKRKQ